MRQLSKTNHTLYRISLPTLKEATELYTLKLKEKDLETHFYPMLFAFIQRILNARIKSYIFIFYQFSTIYSIISNSTVIQPLLDNFKVHIAYLQLICVIYIVCILLCFIELLYTLMSYL